MIPEFEIAIGPQGPLPNRTPREQVAETPATKGSAESLLPTYLGKRTSERVLTGQAKRGTGEKIHAVIWLCDLRDSTLLSETMPIEDFLALLNDFFDCTAGAVLDHNGEILSYIGDAVFAIFPVSGSTKPLHEACTPEEGACAAALAASRDARARVEALNQARHERGAPSLEFGLALHCGDVMYGRRQRSRGAGRALQDASSAYLDVVGLPPLFSRRDDLTRFPPSARHRATSRNLCSYR